VCIASCIITPPPPASLPPPLPHLHVHFLAANLEAPAHGLQVGFGHACAWWVCDVSVGVRCLWCEGDATQERKKARPLANLPPLFPLLDPCTEPFCGGQAEKTKYKHGRTSLLGYCYYFQVAVRPFLCFSFQERGANFSCSVFFNAPSHSLSHFFHHAAQTQYKAAQQKEDK